MSLSTVFVLPMPRFFIETSLRSLSVGAEWVLPERVYHHAVRVRRLRVGDVLTLFDGSGDSWRATLRHIGKNGASASIDTHIPTPSENAFALTLALPLIAADRMDWVLQKGTELGVRAFQLLYSERGGHLNNERLTRRVEHWRGVMIAACEQCGRNTLPELLPLREMTEYLRAENSETLRVAFVVGGETSLSELLAKEREWNAAALLIGAEGGLSDTEKAIIGQAGWRSAHLGPRILRAETAAIVAVALTQAAIGGLDHAMLQRI
ncbi:MAG: 16S rRNA (uracil(1498)-N(3))-methyltransferase [Burkholderiales bacterium]|nr:16S rRNA (uracil(1498)-N(3))-methyltransferase [Burkholderiales bacterium]